MYRGGESESITNSEKTEGIGMHPESFTPPALLSSPNITIPRQTGVPSFNNNVQEEMNLPNYVEKDRGDGKHTNQDYDKNSMVSQHKLEPPSIMPADLVAL